MGTMTVSAGPCADGAESIVNDSAPSQGRLYVPPAHIQTAGDAAVALTSANHKVALGFTPDIDFALDAVSLYVTDIATTGDVALDIHADGTAIEPNGEFNGSYTNAAATMTANNAPGPYVVGLWDSAGANAEASGFEAYRAMDGSVAADDGVRSSVAPTAESPLYYSIDFGSGNEKVINRYAFTSFNNSDSYTRAYPKAWTFWGSNASSPVMQTDDDWTQLSGRIAWTDEASPLGGYSKDYFVANSTAFRHYRWKITDRFGTFAFVSIGEILLCEAQLGSAPGLLLQSLGTKAVGESADVWLRHTFDAYQLQRNTKYWVVFAGAASSDFSLSVRRNHTGPASMFPDGCVTKQTTGGATSWTQAIQGDSSFIRPALLNVVLQSSVHHCPTLVYGRHSGDKLALYDGSAWQLHSIPMEGAKLICDALTARTKYNIFAHDSSGALTLSALTSGLATQNGVEVSVDSAAQRWMGYIGVINVQSTFQGPVHTPDARLVRNRYHTIRNILTKDPGYSGYSRLTVQTMGWRRPYDLDDLAMQFVSMNETLGADLYCLVSNNYSCACGLALDGSTPDFGSRLTADTSTAATFNCAVAGSCTIRPSEGFHTAHVVVATHRLSAYYLYLSAYDAPFHQQTKAAVYLDC